MEACSKGLIGTLGARTSVKRLLAAARHLDWSCQQAMPGVPVLPRYSYAAAYRRRQKFHWRPTVPMTSASSPLLNALVWSPR